MQELENLIILSNKFANNSELINEVEKITKNFPNGTKKRHKILENLVSLLINTIKEKNHKKSIAISRLIFLGNFSNPLTEIKKQGAFRTSKYDYSNTIVKAIIKDIQKLKVIKNNEHQYIESVLNLISLANDVKSEKDKIISAFASRKHFFKTVLAFGELYFSELLYNQENYIPKNIEQSKFYYNKESVLESISLMCQYYQELGLSSDDDSGFLDEKFDKSLYMDFICRAFKIKNFNETEIKIDIFDYQAIKDNKKIIIRNSDFELAKIQGYTKFNARQDSFLKQVFSENNKKIGSLLDFYNQYWDNVHCEQPLYEIKYEPYKRIVLRLINIDDSVILGENSVFLEEFTLLNQTFLENYNDEIAEVEIIDGISILDILKFQRLFFKISYFYRRSLKEYKEAQNSDYNTVSLRSVLPSLKLDDFIDSTSLLSGLSQEKCLKIINSISLDMKSKNDFIDLQYSPIVKLNEYLLVLPTIVSASNLIRSIALKNNKHLSVVNGRDYMINNLKESFKNKGFSVCVDFLFGKDQIEIDLVAYRDNHLFLLECKNPYHPVNDFELRNTYEHIKKAISQIEKFKSIVENKKLFRDFIKNIEFQIDINSVQIHYGIINANRALSGFQNGGIRVFHANELINFLECGKFVCHNVEYNSWRSEQFDVLDLVDYLNGNILDDFRNSFNLYRYGFNYREKELEFETFHWDYEKFKQDISHKYNVSCENVLNEF